MFVGLTGAGKTTYFKSDLEILGYTSINLHDDGEFGSYLELVEQSLAAKKSVSHHIASCLTTLYVNLTNLGCSWYVAQLSTLTLAE